MSHNVIPQVQRNQPFGVISPRRVFSLPIESIHPVIRIAHRVGHPLNIPERIIFDYELVLVTAGSGELVVGGERLRFHARDLLVISPFIPHCFVPGDLDSGEHIAVHFDFAPDVPPPSENLDVRSAYQIRLRQALPRLVSLTPGHRIERLLIDILRERENADSLGRLTASASLAIVLAMLLRAAPEQTVISLKNQIRIRRVIAFAEANLAEKLSVEDLAQVAGISRSRFNTLFQQITTCSPQEYVRRLRIEKARTLLADPDLSVKEIAAQTGFDDSFHFSKVFRRIDGLSPTHYREALLAGYAR